MTRRAAIYARVSTEGQFLDNQLRELRAVSDRAGWAIVAEHVDTASGATAKRAGLERMLADAARRKFDTVLVWDVSRLGRSLRDLVDIFETLRALKIDLVIHQSGIDTQTPAGIAMMQMSGVFAQFERAMIVERTKAGMARARARSAQIGARPTGDGTVAAIRSFRAQGRSMDGIARDLKIGKGVAQRVCQQFDREQGAAQ